MCGIPMEPPADYTEGKRLTFEQAVRHIGGMDNLITDEGMNLIDLNTPYRIWKYPEHGYCTACGADVGDLKAKHGTRLNCPHCGREVEFRHEARGHSRMFWQFCLYEWRRSEIDPETIVLTATHVWKDESRDRPERSPHMIHPTALYIFKPGAPVSYFRNRRWNDDPTEPQYWSRMDSLAPAHTEYQGGRMKVVMDWAGFINATRGTRIGRLYFLLFTEDRAGDMAQTIDAVAACARRPWLEYLYKAGQHKLARQIAVLRRVSRDLIPNQRAKVPRELLGLTEAQWHEVRREGIELTVQLMENIRMLKRMDFDGHMADLIRMSAAFGWRLSNIAPTGRGRRAGYWQETAGDWLQRAPVKLRRRAYRMILADLEHHHEYRDTYAAMAELGEDFADPALVTPRDIHAVHDAMTARVRALRKEIEARKLAEKQRAFAQTLQKLEKRYGFAAAGLVLRPYESAAEVIAEGKALKICIGSYAERYMDGGTVICCLRRAEEPDVPWRAVEFSVRTGKVAQDRGYCNDRNGIEPGTKKQLRLFWAAFDRAHKRKSA